ncbi:MAG: MaoC/PaaZ C-terminal domain-containing protein [Solirubrobacterales bacterium]
MAAARTRTLASAPQVLPLYARAAATLVPGASLLPFVPGGGGEIPGIELELDGVRADRERLAAYARVCGFVLREQLPPTYPHVLAFPLQMAVMTDGSFPFGAVGLVHVANRIVQHRPIAAAEELSIHVRPTALRPHPKGRTFDLQTVVLAAGEVVWDETSTMLHRGKPAENAPPPAMRAEVRSQPEEGLEALGEDVPAGAEWRLEGDLGRRYAAVSGDRNPIHLHPLAARPLGFPAAIAHGMWTKARCLAALGPRLPDAFAVEVRFRKPILLPARVELATAELDEGAIGFAVRDARRKTPHLDGRVR